MITGNHLCWSLFNPFSSYCFVKFSFFWFLCVLFFEGRDKLRNILFPFISIFGSRHWEFFCKTAVWRDVTKIVIFFYKVGLCFQLLNKKVYKFIENEIRLHRYFSRAMVKMSILQLYKTTIFLAQLWMAASNHLFNKCDQKIRQVKNQVTYHIAEEELKQLAFWNCCLVFSNGFSVLWLATSKSQTHYSIALKFSAVQLE